MEGIKAHGFWHYVTYQQCPRKGYFANVLRWEPEFTPPALLKGSMIHAGIAGFRLGGVTCGMSDFYEASQQLQAKFEKAELAATAINSAEMMLKDYFNRNNDDGERYDFIQVEGELRTTVVGTDGVEYPILVKPDAVAYDKQRKMFVIFEVKHSGSLTPEKIYGKLQFTDQATAYIFAWNKLNPDKKVEVVIPDILYHNKGVLYCSRPGDIYRREIDLLEWEVGFTATIKTSAENLGKLATAPAIGVYPRRGDCDGDGFWMCDFKPICRTFIDPAVVPLGFRKKEGGV